MFDLNVLNDQVIIDHKVVNRIRELVQTNELKTPSIGSNLSFFEHVEAQIGFHLRGLDLEVKQLAKSQLISKLISERSMTMLTQRHLAELILNSDFPMERKIKNLQNWVTLSTDYTLNFEEVSKLVLTAQYTVVDVSEPIPSETPETPIVMQPEALNDSVQETYESQESQHFEDAIDFLNRVPNEFIPIENEHQENISDAFLEDDENFDFEESHHEAFYQEELDQDDHPHEKPALLLKIESLLHSLQQYSREVLLISVGLVIAIVFGIWFGKTVLTDHTPVNFSEACLLTRQATPVWVELETATAIVYDYKKSKMSQSFEYKKINIERLNGYLKRRNSILATEPYFSSIIRAAALNDVNPVLLFAISGQEQGFVRLDDPDAVEIANNPFNVYTSWRNYNTNSEDAAHIAAGTILAISREKPENVNSFKWLNQRYAEDPNWWKGVELFFLDIENYIAR